MNPRPEPFSTHRPWDETTRQAYADQPQRGGKHYQLDEDCTEAERQAWRDWCRRYPDHWPNFVHQHIARAKIAGQARSRRG